VFFNLFKISAVGSLHGFFLHLFSWISLLTFKANLLFRYTTVTGPIRAFHTGGSDEDQNPFVIKLFSP